VSRGEANQSGKDGLYEAFFQRLLDDLRKNAGFANARANGKHNWRTFGSGTKGFTYAAVFPAGGRIRAEIYIDRGNREQNLASLEALRMGESAVEHEFGEPLMWEPLKGRRACRIAAYRQGRIEDSELLEEYHRWLVDRLLRFKSVFGKRIG
jgi:hypothetical protein